MTLRLALRQLLPLLAVLSLALTPVAAPAATAGMHAPMASSHHAAMASDMSDMDMAGMDMDDMPCCPKAEAPKPDCAKGCPLMALCLASMASLLPAALRVPVPAATRTSVLWPEPDSFVSLHGPPLPEPPRA
ncbi:hypothetical protein [Methylobacterium sp. J-067]|uniref:hypothetical protein n=1 Tax=Methylobacterium sp. J-067 TaxID=2836648 RepID=UPI001FB8A2FF|nr:hypothetical protein [Methylobacterium sp. J-067]MCJ2024308.1 hypothetical protein [Methylobacterium sp. J-067]